MEKRQRNLMLMPPPLPLLRTQREGELPPASSSRRPPPRTRASADRECPQRPPCRRVFSIDILYKERDWRDSVDDGDA